MYLKHLLYDGKIAVSDQLTRRAIYLTELEVEALVQVGRIQVIARRKRIRGLNWIGPPLDSYQSRNEVPVPEEILGRHDIRHKTKYAHKNETPQNPPNVWTLVPLPSWTRLIFFAVLLGRGGAKENLADRVKPRVPKKFRKR